MDDKFMYIPNNKNLNLNHWLKSFDTSSLDAVGLGTSIIYSLPHFTTYNTFSLKTTQLGQLLCISSVAIQRNLFKNHNMVTK